MEAVISQAVEGQLDTVTNSNAIRTRYCGENRTATARAIADYYLRSTEASDRDTNGIIFVRPDTFAEAIAAPALIHSRQAPHHHPCHAD